VTPADSALRQRVDQHLPQVGALHLGTPARAVVGLVEQNCAVGLQDPHGLAALQDQALELGHQVGGLDGELAVVVVDVEHSALRPRRRRVLCLVDSGLDAVDVQHAGEREAAESGTDDRDVHSGSF
jgi:hypothetical protein